MISSLIDELLEESSLPLERMRPALSAALDGELTDVQLAGLLVAMRRKPVTADLLVAAVETLRERQLGFPALSGSTVDTCGTGGDSAQTFNISTASAFVVAAAGGRVAKHGNRSVSSNSGSADVLQELGVPIDRDPEGASEQLDRHGFAFLFAPQYHPALTHVAGVRRELGIRTLFNLLGPLLNPTGAERQLIGVYDARLTLPVATALQRLGTEKALVVHCDGLDEFGLHAATRGHLLSEGTVESFELDPLAMGFSRAPVSSLRATSAADSAAIIESLLSKPAGPMADVVQLNAGATLFVSGLADSIREGCATAGQVMRSQQGAELLEQIRCDR